nr:hypothetical protein [Rhabdochromatium marinum]
MFHVQVNIGVPECAYRQRFHGLEIAFAAFVLQGFRRHDLDFRARLGPVDPNLFAPLRIKKAYLHVIRIGCCDSAKKFNQPRSVRFTMTVSILGRELAFCQRQHLAINVMNKILQKLQLNGDFFLRAGCVGMRSA